MYWLRRLCTELSDEGDHHGGAGGWFHLSGVSCGKCMKVCHALGGNDWRNPVACYAAQVKNREILRGSTSGGIFFALAQTVLSNGGVVYGCVYDEAYNAYICRADSLEQIRPMHGSKYVWSDSSRSYPQVKKDLEVGREVLYTGLPCQVAGLKKYLGKDEENLFTVDILCGGAPSPYAFRRYLGTIATDAEELKTLLFQFRDKEPYGSGVHCTYYSHGKKHHEDYLQNSFYFAFSSKSRITWRRSCYSCNYKSLNRVSDMTIGDYWGVEKHHSGFRPKDGVSLILVNTEHGNNLFEQIQDEIICEESKVSYAIERNSLVSEIQEGHVNVPPEREQFFKLLQEKGWKAADQRFLNKRKKLIREVKMKRIFGKLKRTISVVKG